ncbi:MAG: class I SAM-dependent methyltransferase [Oscillospiraceae bacterium]
MSAYGPLAFWYDDLTRDVPYGAFADFYEKIFAADGGEHKTLLDLCCGTGTLTCELASRGYELIAVDASPDMLAAAREKAETLPENAVAPLLICQQAAELDLYGTVDAAYSSLDSVSYLPPSDLPEVFRRLRLFVRPGGLLIFDIRTPAFLRGMDGELCVDETPSVLCLWRGRFDAKLKALRYGMDIFEREGALWRRSGEEHIEYAHEPQQLCELLASSGFPAAVLREDGPGGEGRLFIIAKREDA